MAIISVIIDAQDMLTALIFALSAFSGSPYLFDNPSLHDQTIQVMSSYEKSRKG